MVNLNAPPPALQVIWDANYVRMVGSKILHIVDSAAGCTRPDPLTLEQDLPLEVTVLIADERVVLDDQEVRVQHDVFGHDALQVIRFVPVQS